MNEIQTSFTGKTSNPVDSNGNPLKPCCACPETRIKRDECIVTYGEENCINFINAHKNCLRNLGFKV